MSKDYIVVARNTTWKDKVTGGRVFVKAVGRKEQLPDTMSKLVSKLRNDDNTWIVYRKGLGMLDAIPVQTFIKKYKEVDTDE